MKKKICLIILCLVAVFACALGFAACGSVGNNDNKGTYDMSGVVFANSTVTYDGQEHSIIATNLPEGITATYEGNGKVNAGIYTITVHFTGDSENYNVIPDKTATLTISKATYDMRDVVFSDLTIEYDGQAHSIEATNLPNGVSVTYENNGQTHAGEYEIVAKFTGDSTNYGPIPNKTAKLTIMPAELSGISFNNDSFVYDGTPKSIYISGTLPEGISVDYVGNGKINAGEYTVTAKFTTTADYEPLPNLTAKLSINKATYDMGGVAFSGSTVTYDGTPKSIYISGTLPDGVSVDYEGNGKITADTYTVTAKFSGDATNYEPIANKTATLTIAKATYDMSEVVFGNSIVTYNGEEHSIFASNLPNGVAVAYDGNGKINVGEYTVTAHFMGDSVNYEPISDKTAILSILRAKVEGIEFEGETVTYNGQEYSIFVTGSLPNEIIVSYENNGHITAGTYEVTAKFETGKNYEPIKDMVATLVIEKATYDMGGVHFNDESVTYDGVEHSITVIGNLPTGVTVNYEGNDKVEVGEYTVTAHFKGDSTNYETIPDMRAKLTIVRSSVKGITFSGATVTYDGTEHSLAIKGKLPEGVTVTYENNGHITAGTYEVTAKFETGNNYEPIEDMKATLVIRKATYDMSGVSFVGKSVIYNGKEHSIEITGELPNGVSVTYEGNDKTTVGTYTVKAHFNGDSENYEAIPDKTATLKIEKATYDMSSVVFNDLTVKYDGNPHSITATGLPSGVNVTYDNNSQTEKGEYKITAHFTGDNINYNAIPDKTATLTITREIHKVTFKQEGQADKIVEVLDLAALDKSNFPDLVQVNGYTVVWEDKDLSCVTKDITVNAIKTVITYGITYELNSGSYASTENRTTYTVEDSFSFVDPVREGYIFAGWYTAADGGDRVYGIEQGTTGEKTFYARWTYISTIKFDTKGGSAVESITAPAGTSVSAPSANPTKDYYAFAGWYSDINCTQVYNFTVMPEEDITVYAKWTPIEYTITYVLNDGENNSANPKTYTVEDSFSLYAATKTGNTFIGWYDNAEFNGDAVTSISQGSYGEITLWAKWQINTYTIKFVTNGGTSIANMELEYGSVINYPTTQRDNYSFDGWFLDGSGQTACTYETMPAENLTLYAKWKSYAVTISYSESKTAISVFDEITAELFGATAIDTDGNPVEVTATIVGTQEGGNTISVRLRAMGLYDKGAQQTIENIKVYGNPTLSYNTGKDYINLSDTINSALFGLSGVDSFGVAATTSITVEQKNYKAGDLVTVILSSRDVVGNTVTARIENVKVYGTPTIEYNTEKTSISVNDSLVATLFSATAKDSFGATVAVSASLRSGTISAGNTVTIRLSATDSKGNSNYVDVSVKIYGAPTITKATKTDFKVADAITVQTLGLTATDTYGKSLEITLTVKSGAQTSGSTMVYTASVTDSTGNTTTLDISVKIYGTPSISAENAIIKVGDSITATLFKAVAKDSFGTGLTVALELLSGTQTGGTYMQYRLSATDKAGNTSTKTVQVSVYDVNDIDLIYSTMASDCIKLTSRGEEFFAEATDSFGNPCDIRLEAASGFTLKGGKIISLYIVATDIIGNTKRSDLISGIKVYDTPTVKIKKTDAFINEGTDLESLFAVYDSFGEEVYFTVEIVNGGQVSEDITVIIRATDYAGHSVEVYYIFWYTSGIIVESQPDNTYSVIGYRGIDSTIVIPEEIAGKKVTAIVDNAFKNNTALVNITIPSSVKSIGSYVFYNCSSLMSITIPNGVPSIGEYAFYNCRKLTSIEIPDSVASIGSYAFYGCNSLTGITISGRVPSIGDYTFYNCNSLTKVQFPSSVKSIGDYAFYGCESVTSITALSGVTSIGDYAFYNCSKLTGITMPSGLMTIGKRAFYNCSKLTSVTIPNGVKSIEEFTFYNCISLDYVIIGNNVESIGNYAFDGCNALWRVTIGSSVTSIGANAFRECDIRSLSIPNSVTSIGMGAFYSNSNLWNITLPFIGATKTGTSYTNFGYIFGASSYSNNSSYVPESLTTVTITGGTSIGNYAFYYCSNLTSIIMPNTVTSIGNRAFYYCSSLTSIEIPDSVMSIGEYAFSGCSGLTSMTIPFVGNSKFATEASSSTLFGYIFGGLSYTGGTETSQEYSRVGNTIYTAKYYIPTTLKEVSITGGNILYGAFSYCKNLTTVTIGENVASMGGNAFYYCSSLATVYWNAANCTSADTSSKALHFSACDALKTIVIGDNVKAIPAYAFSGAGVNSITIPSSVTSIGDYAFYDCSLRSISIPSSVTSIGDYAFAYNSGAWYLTIGSGVTSIGELAFYNCSSLKSITIPQNVTSIGYGAFGSCIQLTSVEFENTKGWMISVSGADSTWGVISGSLTSKDTAAKLLTSTYERYYWKRF